MSKWLNSLHCFAFMVIALIAVFGFKVPLINFLASAGMVYTIDLLENSFKEAWRNGS